MNKKKRKHLTFFRENFLVFSILMLFLWIPHIDIDGYIQSTVTSKFLVFGYAVIAIAPLYLVHLFISKQSKFQFSKIDYFLGILFTYISINKFFIQEVSNFSLRYYELLGMTFLYIFLRRLSVKNYIWLAFGIVISGSIQAIFGNLQLLGYYPSNHGGFKMTGSFFNPGPFAGFLTSTWLLSLGMYLFKENTISLVISKNATKLFKTLIKYSFEYIPLLGIVSVLLVLPASQSRAAWLAVLTSSAIAIEVRYRFLQKLYQQLNTVKKTVLIFGSLAILIAGFIGIYSFKKGSSDGRLFIWKIGSKIIQDHPISGVGFDRFEAHYMNYQTAYFAKKGETSEAMVADNTNYAFNEWLQFGIENGSIGIFILVVGLFFLFRVQTKEKHLFLANIFRMALIAIGVFAFFSYPMQILPVKLVLLFLLAGLAIVDKQKKGFLKNKQINLLFKIGFACFAVFVSFKGVQKLGILEKGFYDWQTASEIYQYSSYEDALEEYEDTYSTFQNNGVFLMNYGKTLAMAEKYDKARVTLERAKKYTNTTIIETALGDSYKALKKYDKAEKAYQHAADMIPSRFYPYYLLANLYEESGQHEKALVIAKKLLTKEVKVYSTAIKEIKAEMKKIITQDTIIKNEKRRCISME